jgi:N utilization substance protein A
MDIASESRRAVSELFGDADSYGEELSRISELPGVDSQVAAALLENNVDFIEDFLALTEEEAAQLKGVSAEQIVALRLLIEEFVEVVEEEEPYGENPEEAALGADAPGVPDEDAAADLAETAAGGEGVPEEEAGDAPEDELEEYECPECGAKITVDMTNCPNCGIGLSFEFEDA